MQGVAFLSSEISLPDTMPRQARLDTPCTLHHLFQYGGLARRAIFTEGANRARPPPHRAEGRPTAAPWGLRHPSGAAGDLCLSATNAAPRRPSSASRWESPSLGPRVPIQSHIASRPPVCVRHAPAVRFNSASFCPAGLALLPVLSPLCGPPDNSFFVSLERSAHEPLRVHQDGSHRHRSPVSEKQAVPQGSMVQVSVR